jgi:spore maturation protein CgeB
MKILLVHPGASFSVHDLFVGYGDALTRLGHEVYPYRLDEAIEDMGRFHHWKWRADGKQGSKPSSARIFYDAGVRYIEAALRLKADWVLLVSGMYTHPDTIVMGRRAGLRLALLASESPYDDAQQAFVAPYVDMVFTNERTSVPVLGRANPNTFYLPHAYAPWHAEPLDGHDDVFAHDVVFVGTGFQERLDLLQAVDWSGIDLGLYGSYVLMGSRSKLRQHLAGGVVSNHRTAALYRKAKIGLNLYRTSMGFGKTAPRVRYAESLNPRAYELAASGCFQLSDDRRELHEVFGDAVPTFSDSRHLEKHIRWFLDRETDRRALAARAQRAVEPHTYEARAAVLVSELTRRSQAA